MTLMHTTPDVLLIEPSPPVEDLVTRWIQTSRTAGRILPLHHTSFLQILFNICGYTR